MATRVAMINMKGGVGKTTLTVQLAYWFAEQRGKRVLVVDLDPQFNATQYFLGELRTRQLFDAFLSFVREGPATSHAYSSHPTRASGNEDTFFEIGVGDWPIHQFGGTKMIGTNPSTNILREVIDSMIIPPNNAPSSLQQWHEIINMNARNATAKRQSPTVQ